MLKTLTPDELGQLIERALQELPDLTLGAGATSSWPPTPTATAGRC